MFHVAVTMALRGERKIEIKTKRMLVPAVYWAAAPSPAHARHVHDHIKGGWLIMREQYCSLFLPVNMCNLIIFTYIHIFSLAIFWFFSIIDYIYIFLGKKKLCKQIYFFVSSRKHIQFWRILQCIIIPSATLPFNNIIWL